MRNYLRRLALLGGLLAAVTAGPFAGTALAGSEGAQKDEGVPNFQSYSAQIQAVSALLESAAANLTGQLNVSGMVKGTISVANVSGKSGSISLSADISVDAGGGEIIHLRQFLVLAVAPMIAISEPKALAVVLAGMVSRTLIQGVVRELAARNSSITVAMQDVAKQMAEMSEADFDIEAPKG